MHSHLGLVFGADHTAVGIGYVGDEAHLLLVFRAFEGDAQAHGGIVLTDVRRCDAGAPCGDVHGLRRHHVYVAVKSRAGIPARRAGHVVQAHGENIVASVAVDVWRDITVERVVAVWPEYGLMAVDVDTRFAHGSVEDKCGVLARRHAEAVAVPARAHEGQSARATCHLRCFCLSVLLDGNVLHVIVAAEGAVDGPVVRHADGLPLRVVTVCLHGSGIVATDEFPVLLNRELTARLLCRSLGKAQQCEARGEDVSLPV